MQNAKNMPQPLLIGLLVIGGGLVVLAFYLGFVVLNRNTGYPEETEGTTVALIATQIVTIQPTTTRFATVTPSPIPRPRSCDMLKQQQPTAGDGAYTIYLNGRTAVTLYCHNMETTPVEYLTLPATANGANYSLISYPEGAIITQYEKVRLHPGSLVIDATDMTFAITAESLAGYIALSADQLSEYLVTSSDFGRATGCNRNQEGAPLGRANIDLTGTPFIVSPDITFTSFGGELQEASSVVSEDGKTVNLAINGRCGVIHPTAPIQLIYPQP